MRVMRVMRVMRRHLVPCGLSMVALVAHAGAQTPGGVANPTLRASRYRVTLNGITVQRQTYDHALEIDGKGDEIYVAAYVAVIDTGAASMVDHWVVRSREMGDQNGFPGRVRLGMASGKGGIRTGNRHPLPSPFRRVGALAADSLPMVLWEGSLVPGRSAVVLAPTVWEWDDNPELFGYWVVSRGALIDRLTQPELLLGILANRSWGPVELGSPGLLVQTNMFGDVRDRPIGLELGHGATGVGFTPAGQIDPAKDVVAPGGSQGRYESVVSAVVRQLLGNVRTAANVMPGFDTLLGSILRRQGPLMAGYGGYGAGKGPAGGKGATTPAASAPGGDRRLRLPWDAASAALVRDSMRRHVTMLEERAGNRPVMITPIVGLARGAATVVRDYTATQLHFFEKTLVLTPAAIDAALREASVAAGRAPGTIDVAYADHNPLQGRYVLHLQVERLP
jgi:hypothetical protein